MRLSPWDRIENPFQLRGSGRVDHLDMADFAGEVGREVGSLIVVLGGGAVAGAVGEDGFEAVEFSARKIGFGV